MRGFVQTACLVLAIGFVLSGCKRLPLAYQAKDHPVPQIVQSKLDDEAIEKVIVKAAVAKNWMVERVRPGHLRATLNIRSRHTAVSDIFFSQKSFSIMLNTSHGLKQDSEGHIHRAYNKAVHDLEFEIERSLYQAGYEGDLDRV